MRQTQQVLLLKTLSVTSLAAADNTPTRQAGLCGNVNYAVWCTTPRLQDCEAGLVKLAVLCSQSLNHRVLHSVSKRASQPAV